MFRSLARRVWWLGLIVSVIPFAGCGVTLTPPGFVHEHRHSVCRGWFDFNSYCRPSFTFERYDQLPPNSARVKLFRWRHAGSVETVPQIEILKDSAYATYSDSGTSTLENCPDTAAPMVMEGNPEEPLDLKDNSVPPPPAPPSESEEPSFPELNLPNPELDDSIVASPPDQGDNPVLVVLGFSEEVDDPQERNEEPSLPFIPPPPAPPIE